MKKNKIYFRADGHAKVGLGHVIRSLALAEMLKEDFECHFIIQNPLLTIRKQILAVCKSITELPITTNYEAEAKYIVETFLAKKKAIVVLDGYCFRTNYQKIIKAKVKALICIDDIYAYHFVADAVINHAGGITPQHYSAEPYTMFYLGLSYALLRKPFRDIAQQRSYPERQDNNIFICLGGADPTNEVLNVLRICEQTSNLEKCYVVLGSAYLHQKALENYLAKVSLDVTLLSNLNAIDMVHYMKKCSMAITSPSTISYEYLSVGGLLYLKVIADNQVNINRYFLEEKLALPVKKLPVYNQLSLSLKTTILQQQEELFDGQQQKRFLSLFRYYTLDYREANQEDCLLYFEWANDKAARLQSFNTNPISLAQHQKWFAQKIANPQTKLYLITQNDIPIGQIRFDTNDQQEAVISYSLAKVYRRRGLGALLLKKGVRVFQANRQSQCTIIGFVKKTNTASIKAFRQLGFTEEEADTFPDSYKYTLI